MGKSPEDASAMKLVRSEFGRRMIDFTHADIRVANGVCTIRGVLKPMKGGPADMKSEIGLVARILRQRAGIREVVLEATIRSA